MTGSPQGSHTSLRRLRVASLYLRGLSPTEIGLALPKNGVVDPATHLPYGMDVVHGDIAYLEREWESETQRAPWERRARVLAELHEAKRAAWAKGDLGTVVRCLKQETELFDLDDVPEEAAPLLELT